VIGLFCLFPCPLFATPRVRTPDPPLSKISVGTPRPPRYLARLQFAPFCMRLNLKVRGSSIPFSSFNCRRFPLVSWRNPPPTSFPSIHPPATPLLSPVHPLTTAATPYPELDGPPFKIRRSLTGGLTKNRPTSKSLFLGLAIPQCSFPKLLHHPTLI